MLGPEGALDTELPLLRAVAGSLRPTPRWKAMADAVGQEIVRIAAETGRVTPREAQRRSRAISETGDAIREMSRDSWERQQASSDRMSRAWSNAMRGVDDYALPDGSTRSLDGSYDHVFTNSLGEFVVTDDPTFDPNRHSTQTWQRSERVTPMGAAAGS